MADVSTSSGDPLALLRQAISLSRLPILATSDSPDAETDSFAKATHLVFSSPTASVFLLNTPTRFIGASGASVDVRSIFFAWQHKDDPIPDYIASAETLNNELGEEGGPGGKVHQLPFVERLDLITWLEGSSNESEYIKPSEADATASAPAGSSLATAGAAAGATATSAAVAGRPVKTVDPRLREIYNNERRMGDRNSVLRGIKPTVGLALRRHCPC